MLRTSISVILLLASGFSLSACSTPPPTPDQQTAVKAELAARGFANPVYSEEHDDWSLYRVGIGACRLVVGEKEGSFAWLVKPGNNQHWNFWVTGDDQLNAEWLRAHPKGKAVTQYHEVIPYDLTPCLEESGA